MNDKIGLQDPISHYNRKVAAARRVGNKKCACGESRPEALITKGRKTSCVECKRKKEGRATTDNHHPAGVANNPTTITTPVNDHRAELSVAQQDWPKKTRENPDGSPLLAAAGCVRGFVDTIVYLIKKTLIWIADMGEKLDAYLEEILGRKWWLRTDIEQFMPSR